MYKQQRLMKSSSSSSLLLVVQALVLVGILLVCSCPTRVFVVDAWGKVGHEMIANIAYQRLSHPTRQTVHAILGTVNTTEAGSPLAAVADWADKVRYTKAYWWTAPLHFIDIQDKTIPGGCPIQQQQQESVAADDNNDTTTTTRHCTFNYHRDCQNDICVAGAIVNYSNYLSRFGYHYHHYDNDGNYNDNVTVSTTTTRLLLRGYYDDEDGNSMNNNDKWERRLLKDSLMFVTHFVGDIHQPLHCARQSDRGGNTLHVHFNVSSSSLSSSNNNNVNDHNRPRRRILRRHHQQQRRTAAGGRYHHRRRKGDEWNLHSVWDDGIIDRALVDVYENSRDKFEDDLFLWIANATDEKMRRWLACADGRNTRCTSEWAEESLDDALVWAYRNSDDTEVVDGSVLSSRYCDSRLEVIKKRIAVAGIRLAATLELALGRTEEVKTFG